MHVTNIVILSVAALVFGSRVESVDAGEAPPAKPLVVARFEKPWVPGQIELIPRIRVVEQDQCRPKVIDLELRRNLYEAECLYVADPFFTCQWPMYSAVLVYNSEGECVRHIEIPPPEIWDGETQGREFQPGQICGRRFVVSYTGGNPNPPVTKAPLKRMRMQLVLFDGIAVGPDPVWAISRTQAVAKLSGEVVARSELVDLGQIPSDAWISLVDPEFSEASVHVKSGVALRLEGLSSHTSQSESSYVDVVLHNNTSTQAPLFEPSQSSYGLVASPLEREVVSLPDNQRVFHSKDGIVISRSRLRPGEGIIKLPPHTFCGRSQPWIETRKPGKFKLNVAAHQWILCPLKYGKYTVEHAAPSLPLTAASLEYTVD